MLKIILAIVLFSVIVIFHELGHFLFAKKNGICVEEFAIGIGPTIFGKQIGETKYSIKCLPFGGCCVMLGEDDDCKDPRAFGSQSALARFSVLLCFFISMIITNDVTLITFVPFTIILLEISHQKSKLIYIVTLETISANLGSMTTPIGNPQNLYLFSNYNMNIDEFIIAIIPYSVLSLVLLVVLSLFVGNESITVEKELNRVKGSKNSFLPIMYGILFILALFSVFKILDYRVLLGVLLIAILSLDRITLIKVDYSLIFTFVFLFIFIGNLGNIEYIHNFLQGIIIGNEVWVGVLSSQIFSNVPASILLSKFTDNGSALLIGVNIGGLGTLIASMASLISFKFLQNENIKISRYIIVFTFMNLVFLGINLLWYVLV